MRGCNCSFIIETGHSSNRWLQLELQVNSTFQIPVKYIVYTQFLAANALLKKTLSIEELMAAATFVK